MKTIDDRIEEIRKAIADPSTWSDERSNLKEDLAGLLDIKKAAKENASLLLAIAKDLAYGTSTTPHDKMVNARQRLREAGLLTYHERTTPDGDISEDLKFYNDHE